MEANIESFDISLAEAGAYRMTKQKGLAVVRLGILGILLIGVVGLGLLVPEIVRGFPHLVSSVAGLEILTILALILAYIGLCMFFLASTFRRGGRGPTRIDIRPGGFTLRWQDGAHADWNWAGLRGSLRIDDFRDAGLGYSAAVKIGPFQWAALTSNSLDSLLASAEQCRLSVTRVESPGDAFTVKSTRVVIRRKVGSGTGIFPGRP